LPMGKAYFQNINLQKMTLIRKYKNIKIVTAKKYLEIAGAVSVGSGKGA